MSQTNNAANFPLLSKPQRNSAMPKWSTTTSITMAYLYERDQFNQYNMQSSSTLTASLSSSGAGGILTSANLAGTVSVSSASTTVTGTGTTFTSSFIVGDVINTSSGIQSIVSITNDTTLTVYAAFTSTASGLTYTRGGPAASSCLYYLYAIAKPFGLSPSIAFSNRSIFSGDSFPTSDLPTGYTLYREMPFTVYLLNGTIKTFRLAEGWPYSPLILYEESSVTGSTYNGIPSTSSVTPTVIAGFDIPKNAKSVLLNMRCTTAGTIYLKDALGTMQIAAVVGVDNQIKVAFPAGGPNTFSLYTTTAGARVEIWVMGYYLSI